MSQRNFPIQIGSEFSPRHCVAEPESSCYALCYLRSWLRTPQRPHGTVRSEGAGTAPVAQVPGIRASGDHVVVAGRLAESRIFLHCKAGVDIHSWPFGHNARNIGAGSKDPSCRGRALGAGGILAWAFPLEAHSRGVGVRTAHGVHRKEAASPFLSPGDGLACAHPG